MLLAGFARRDVTVVLTGEGADEVFGGYSNYRKRVREERLTRWLAHSASPLPAIVKGLPATWRKDRLLRSMTEPLERRYRTIPNVFDVLLHAGLFTQRFLQATAKAPDIGAIAAAAFDEAEGAPYLDRLLHVDTRLWLPDDLLTKVDRATMTHSLEARVPYLDHRFVEFCARLDPSLKIQGDTHKHLLKRVAARYLPADVVDRGKQGFVMPLTEWLAGKLAGELDDHLGERGLARRGLFRNGVLPRLLAEHRRGRRNHAGTAVGAPHPRAVVPPLRARPMRRCRVEATTFAIPRIPSRRSAGAGRSCASSPRWKACNGAAIACSS